MNSSRMILRDANGNELARSLSFRILCDVARKYGQRCSIDNILMIESLPRDAPKRKHERKIPLVKQKLVDVVPSAKDTTIGGNVQQCRYYSKRT